MARLKASWRALSLWLKIVSTIGVSIIAVIAFWLSPWPQKCGDPDLQDALCCGDLGATVSRCCEPDRSFIPSAADIPGQQCWLAYSPTNYNPNHGRFPSATDLREDLGLLNRNGFSGLVTYSAESVLGSELPKIAGEQGFTGMIMGIWDPSNRDELSNAIKAGALPIIKGYVVGNEGLHPQDGSASRYDLCHLQQTMRRLRNATGKPVTTTEDSRAYQTHAELYSVGDWVFPNARPFWAGKSEPVAAAIWVRDHYDHLPDVGRPAMLKEVGLPTIASSWGAGSEAMQRQFFLQLQQVRVSDDRYLPFVYFEAFDQPWKQAPGDAGDVERAWGLFRPDRSAKTAAECVCGRACDPCDTPGCGEPSCGQATPVSTAMPHWVYQDYGAAGQLFTATGYMGDSHDLSVDESFSEQPLRAGGTSLRLVYKPSNGQGSCGYLGPCKFVGLRWLYPANNWGKSEGGALDLRGFRRVRFWARSDESVRVKFLVGGVPEACGDSNKRAPIEVPIALTPEWSEHEIDLAGADLSHIISGFGVTINWPDNGIGSGDGRQRSMQLDDIRFEP